MLAVVAAVAGQRSDPHGRADAATGVASSPDAAVSAPDSVSGNGAAPVTHAANVPATTTGPAGQDSAPVIRLAPSDDAQAVVDAAPPGATIQLMSGVHERFSVQPKSGQTFRGEPGTILDGGDVADHAFYTFGSGRGVADGVTIVGASAGSRLVIRHYAGALQTGAIHPHVDTRPELGMARDWTVRWVDVRDNRATGIRLADGMTVRDSVVQRNGQLGIGGAGVGITLSGNEVSYNRTRDDVDPRWEGGGVKLVTTRDAVVEHNVVHHNRGTGLWSDIEAIGTVFASNVVSDNEGAGIFDEISYGAEIRDNTVERNGTKDDGWFWNAGIQVAASSNVTIANNTVSRNRQGIMLIQQRRGTGSRGDYRVDNIVVRGNELTDNGVTGAARDDYGALLYDADIQFESNRYQTDLAEPFFWNDTFIDLAAWRALGFDR